MSLARSAFIVLNGKAAGREDVRAAVGAARGDALKIEVGGRLRGPGFEWDGEFLVRAVGNGRQAGGGHPLCPEAMLNDGLLDVRVLPRLPNDKVQHALRALLRHGLDSIQHAVVGARPAPFEVETDENLQIDLDGEPVSGTRFRFEVLPKRLTMALPSECALLA